MSPVRADIAVYAFLGVGSTLHRCGQTEHKCRNENLFSCHICYHQLSMGGACRGPAHLLR